MKNMKKLIIKTNETALSIIGGIVLASLSWSASAQVTFNGSNGELSGLTPTVGSTGGNSLPTYNTPNANAWTLVSGDNVGGGGLAQFQDEASILIPNGYGGASLGTLSSLLTQGAAGNVYFDLKSMTPANGSTSSPQDQYAYWDVKLTDPDNPSAYVLIANAYSDNTLGKNPFNQGAAGNSSVDVSAYVLNGASYVGEAGATWATVAAQTPVGGDPTLANWNVADLSISVGGWDTGYTQTGVIDSVTVPGTAGVPDGASTLSLLGLGFGAMAGLRRRLHRA